MLDTVLTGAQVILSLGIIGLGLKASLRAPKPNKTAALRIYKLLFVALAVAQLVDALWIAQRTSQMNLTLLDEERKRRDATVDVVELAPVSGQNVLASGRTLNLVVCFEPRSNEARQLYSNFQVFNQMGDVSPEQASAAWKKFLEANSSFMETGPAQNVGEGDRQCGNIIQSVSQDEVDDLTSHRKTMYVLFLARWHNPSGSEDHRSFCWTLNNPELHVIGGPHGANWKNCPTRAPY